jgi:aromatic-amino-acid transaminase
VTFGLLEPPLADPLLALMARFRADTRVRKVDLGVGVYRDAHGATPVFAAVKAAERHLLRDQDTKAYLGVEGDLEMVNLLGAEALNRPRLHGLQTVGGTGALRLAAELLATTRPRRRIWLGMPTWPNHVPIFTAAGLTVATVDLCDGATRAPRPAALLEALYRAAPGDAVLLHACCHNPTGIDPEPRFWDELAAVIVARGLVPLVDMAYQGLGRGWREDGAGVERLADTVPTLLVAYSCDKNFGLYRERVGALFVAGAEHTAGAEHAAGSDAVAGPKHGHTQALLRHLTHLARASYSMPPDHGAAVVRTILADAALTGLWRAELDSMRERIALLRRTLAAYGRIGAIDLASLAQGHGMFAMLPLSSPQIDALEREHGIYLAQSGRINIAGLPESMTHVIDALGAVQRQHAA